MEEEKEEETRERERERERGRENIFWEKKIVVVQLVSNSFFFGRRRVTVQTSVLSLTLRFGFAVGQE